MNHRHDPIAMTDLDDTFARAPRRTMPGHDIGQPLDMLSVEELHVRIELLREEIRRLETARDSKIASKAAADQFFKF